MPASAAAPPLAGARSFIETQFPVSRLSIESYRERKAVAGQTLTGLGKWWGRKPLVLVRAAILGVLLPATDDPAGDRETFLALMTMDDDGLRRRRKSIPARVCVDLLDSEERDRFLTVSDSGRASWAKGLSKADRAAAQDTAFDRMPYEDKLQHAVRPEHLDGPGESAWAKINAHLGTAAANLRELVAELGERRWGRVPRVGDAFCGGGSVPFEAARIGCDAYGSDLNPVAGLLTWAALNIVGGGAEVADRVRAAQEEVYAAVDRQVTEWGIEHDGAGRRADAYLYCCETRDPESGYLVPMAPSWVIAEKTKVCAVLTPDHANKRFDIEIVQNAPPAVWKAAKSGATGTVRNGRLCPPLPGVAETPIEALRGDGRAGGGYGLRQWEKSDLVPRPDDVFGERLYCVRWKDGDGKRSYEAVGAADLEREKNVLQILTSRLPEWENNLILKWRGVEPGQKTTEVIRTRGWTYWHHLFTPRQLLVNGLFAERVTSPEGLLLLGRMANANSRLSRWKASNGGGIGGVVDVYSNQALNTLWNYAHRPVTSVDTLLFSPPPSEDAPRAEVDCRDARKVATTCDIWVTDPPYADAVVYHELSELFIAWYDGALPRMFKGWEDDSHRGLAVQGRGAEFCKAMAECYEPLRKGMPDNGLQVVMFTHQDSAVWTELTAIMWEAELKVSAAWCIATETEATGIKSGNHVQGTVLLVLRKKLPGDGEEVFLDELYPRVEEEVRRQVAEMRAIDADAATPSFGDTDYQLAAYAAALRVLTGHELADFDVRAELARDRGPGEVSPVQTLIDDAVKIAADLLVPRGVDRDLWRHLGRVERFLVKGLDLERGGEARAGTYQELARGLGVTEYQFLQASGRANETRLKTPSELARTARSAAEESDGDRAAFAASLTRQVLYAVFQTAEKGRPRRRRRLPADRTERDVLGRAGPGGGAAGLPRRRRRPGEPPALADRRRRRPPAGRRGAERPPVSGYRGAVRPVTTPAPRRCPPTAARSAGSPPAAGGWTGRSWPTGCGARGPTTGSPGTFPAASWRSRGRNWPESPGRSGWCATRTWTRGTFGPPGPPPPPFVGSGPAPNRSGWSRPAATPPAAGSARCTTCWRPAGCRSACCRTCISG